MSGGHRYETATISDHATAILGNKYGDIINIHQATFLLQPTQTTQLNNGPSKIVRHNQVLPGGQRTVESITTFNDGHHFLQRGSSQQIEICWTRCENIGVGSFGEVHREQTEENGRPKSRAVKVLRKRRLEHMQIDHKKELDALIDLSQPDFAHRFVEFYSWYESHDEIHLAMEYVPCGDLDSYLRTGLSESDTRHIAYQVLDGIRIMHRLDLIHRDIKPANIFVVQREPVWWVKLGDFSICKRSTTRQTVLRTQVGTQGYQAPEVLGLVRTKKQNMYDSKCDIWSFGCLVFEMLTAQLPFPDIGTLNNYCNDETPFPGLLIKNSGGTLLIAEFVWWMLQADPVGRPTADQAMFLLSYQRESKAVFREDFEDSDHLYLEDCIRRHFKIPWQYCYTWIEMDFTLRNLCSYIERDGIGQQISKGYYELKDKQGTCLHSQNWEQAVAPGMCVFVSIRSDPSKEILSQAKLSVPEDLTNDLKHRPGSQYSSDDPIASNKSTEKSSEIRENSRSYKAPTRENTGPVVGLASGETDHRTLINSEETRTGVAPTNNTVDPDASNLNSPLLQSGASFDVSEADEMMDAHLATSEMSNETPDQWADHEAATLSTAPPQNGMFKTVKGGYMNEGVQGPSDLAFRPRTDLNTYKPAPLDDAIHVTSLDLTKKTRPLVESFDVPQCADTEHTKKNALVEDEVHFGDKAYVEAKAHVDHEEVPASSKSHSLADALPKAPKNLATIAVIDYVHCSKCLLRIPVGQHPCFPCKTSRLEKRVFLVDWQGNVRALLSRECHTWARMRQLINDCMIEDPWYPMVKRGYFSLIDLQRGRCVINPDSWGTLVTQDHWTTVKIALWLNAWILNLPSNLTVKQFTQGCDERSNTSNDTDIEPPKLEPIHGSIDESVCLRRINFMDRYGSWLNIPWNRGKNWHDFLTYIWRRQVDRNCDLFILELNSAADAMSWLQIRPEMHVYELVYPDCSSERIKQVEYVARNMLWLLEYREKQFRLQGPTTISTDQDDSQDDYQDDTCFELPLPGKPGSPLPAVRSTSQTSGRTGRLANSDGCDSFVKWGKRSTRKDTTKNNQTYAPNPDNGRIKARVFRMFF